MMKIGQHSSRNAKLHTYDNYLEYDMKESDILKEGRSYYTLFEGKDIYLHAFNLLYLTVEPSTLLPHESYEMLPYVREDYSHVYSI